MSAMDPEARVYLVAVLVQALAILALIVGIRHADSRERQHRARAAMWRSRALAAGYRAAVHDARPITGDQHRRIRGILRRHRPPVGGQ